VTAGPWIVIPGAVITDVVIVQRLTDSVWVGLDSVMNESRIMHVASVFHALRMNLIYYDSGRTVLFKYIGFLEDDPSCIAIHARMCTEPVRNIVKFVECYTERVHKILKAKGLAPELLYCGSPQLDKDQ
jgi:hypothetical protein